MIGRSGRKSCVDPSAGDRAFCKRLASAPVVRRVSRTSFTTFAIVIPGIQFAHRFSGNRLSSIAKKHSRDQPVAK
jgi:hypothetical protein